MRYLDETFYAGDDALVHEPSGVACCVHHVDKRGLPLPPCEECKHCRQLLRPEAMDRPCPARGVEKDTDLGD